jgi:sugar lactone lactonase YvrE
MLQAFTRFQFDGLLGFICGLAASVMPVSRWPWSVRPQLNAPAGALENTNQTVERVVKFWEQSASSMPAAHRLMRREAGNTVVSATRYRVRTGWVQAAFVFFATAMVCLSGCTSNFAVKSISVTDPTGAVTGQLSSLTVGQVVKVSMTPLSDPTNAGESWSVTCGGSPITGSITNAACGFLSQSHTPDGTAAYYTAPAVAPLGGTVTITVVMIADPAYQTSITLPVNVLPVSVAMSVYPNAPTSIGVGGQIYFSAIIANDVQAKGSNWTVTCQSSNCGSFSQTTTLNTGSVTYTAPPYTPTGGYVTITETSNADPTQSVSLKLQVVSVTISLSPTTLYVQTSGPYERGFVVANVANDSSGLGVTWAANCAAPCFITPQTVSGQQAEFYAPNTIPTGGTVTLTATSMAEPTVSATATATVISIPPIEVSFVSPPPASLQEGAQTSLAANVLNDTTSAGVQWTATCGSAGQCGTFNPPTTASGVTTMYTAPAGVPAGGGDVSIVANSLSSAPFNPAATDIAITAPPPPVPVVNISLQPAATLLENAQTPVAATVTNDVAAGGVNWTVSCTTSATAAPGACGSVSPYHTASGASATYTAPPLPPLGGVTITATTVAAPVATATSTPITIQASAPLSITFLPYTPTSFTAGTTTTLTAAVNNDSTNGGVDWSVCPSGCGYFTIVPAIPAIPATTTTPYIPAVQAVFATTVPGWSNGLPITYTAPETPPQSGTVTITAAAHVNNNTSVAAPVEISLTGLGPMLQGVVQAGTQPVVGAQVSMYAAGTKGLGSASTPVVPPGSNLLANTDQNGHFTIAAGYACPQPNSQMYLVATGGQVEGLRPNPSLSMVTALGSCSNLASTPVVVNEVTTVAAAWSLAQFAANDELNGNLSYLNIGSSSADATALANSFATVSNLADITTGRPRYTVPTGFAAVPYAEINTLADMLNSCTASAGGTVGDGSMCGTLFYATNTLGYGSQQITFYPPADTFQAAVNVAQLLEQSPYNYIQTYELGNFPVGQTCPLPGGTCFGTGTLIVFTSPASPFQPILSTAPNDWSISLNFTGVGGLTSTSAAKYLAVDNSGNLWMTDTQNNRVIEWNNMGAAVTPSTGYTSASLQAPGALALDLSGNAWICDNSGLTVLNSMGQEIQGSPFSGGGLTGDCQNLAIDGSGNVWTANNGTSISRFTGLGTPVSPSTGYTIPVSPTVPTLDKILPQMAIDDSGNVWVTVIIGNVPPVGGSSVFCCSNSFGMAELSPNGGTPYLLDNNSQQTVNANYNTSYASPGNGSASTEAQAQIATDASGRVWILSSIGPTSYGPYGGLYATLPTSGYSYLQGFGGIEQYQNPNGIAVDGSGRVWSGSEATAPYNGNFPAGMLAYLPSVSDGAYLFANPSFSNPAQSVAIDGSGNVWALMNNNTITEFIGAGTPVVAPLSLAVKNKKLGATP